MYSNSASPQLAKIAIHIGRLLNLRCPYQAAVMKQFERIRRPIVGSALIMRASMGFVAADRNENHSRKTLLSRTYRRGGELRDVLARPPSPLLARPHSDSAPHMWFFLFFSPVRLA